MALKCPNCRSADTVALVDKNQCHNCGALFNFDGSEAKPGMDDNTRAVVESRLADRTTVVGGNYADLQRIGAAAATATGKNSNPVGDAVAVPPNAGPGELVSPAEHEASRGEWTRETQRTGLVDEPQPPEPAEETGSKSFDPGSQSPASVEAADVPAPSASPDEKQKSAGKASKSK